MDNCFDDMFKNENVQNNQLQESISNKKTIIQLISIRQLIQIKSYRYNQLLNTFVNQVKCSSKRKVFLEENLLILKLSYFNSIIFITTIHTNSMSLEVFKHKIGPFIEKFPLNLDFRVRFMQHQLLYNKDFFYFGASMGQMRHGTYGLCFKMENNGNLVVYQGSWLKDQYDGKGSLFLISAPRQKNNQFFRWTEGNWKNGKLNGKGIIKQYNHEDQQWQIKYEGQFLQNHRHGKGIQYFNNNRYEGSFFNGCRHGLGRLVDQNGNFYDGNFFEGFPKGQGLQLKGGAICVKDKDEHIQTYEKPSTTQLPNFIAKTIKNL